MGRKLTDLYVRGKELTFDDGAPGEDPIKVWLQKLNPVQQEQAQKRAEAARAKVLSIVHLPEEAAEKQIFYDEVASSNPSKEDLITILIATDLAQCAESAEAEVAARDEWLEDGYLQGLQEAWENGAREDMFREETPEYDEARRVFDELKKFNEQVEEILQQDERRLRKDYEGAKESSLVKKVVERRIRTHADRAWITEFRKCELWMAVRDFENRSELMFENRAEVDDLSLEVLSTLITEYQNLVVPPTEGKG